MNARCRATMEDAMTFVDEFSGEPDSAFFGVFDGHGGAPSRRVWLGGPVRRGAPPPVPATRSTSLARCPQSATWCCRGVATAAAAAAPGRHAVPALTPRPLHGGAGRDVADFVHSNIANVLEEEMKKTEDMAHVWGATYLTVDSMSHRAGHNTSGCTAVTCLVRRKGDHRYLYTANVGDARAVLARSGRAVRLTQVRGTTGRAQPPPLR